ncbi:alpha/beta hydrolase [Plebeiibacterium marinum]|uniref:Alpha/beta hydrolase n=1 Tax=Plebeiibacterium marinum TaxID=2992111 RepID=A0AAE3MAX5_9BACT|nr:alpha/beta hydrolase [Plebeiobacterium marinum]MCW3804072.1 alpha/beta hydrolase [Plebeiobacterium marinum]
MKNLLKLLFFTACIGLFTGCEKQDEIVAPDALLKKTTIVNHEAPGLDHERFVTMKETGLNIHYRIIGKGPIDMVFIPGWTNPHTVYSKQFDYFRDKARCIYIDLPGTGWSDAPSPATPIKPDATGPQYTMELMAEAMYTVIKKEGIHKFVGVGFSMGPKVLAMFERQNPGMMYKLIVIDGWLNPWPTDPEERTALIQNNNDTYNFMLTWDSNIKSVLVKNLIPDFLSGPDAEELKEWGSYFADFPTDIMANTGYYVRDEYVNSIVNWDYPKLCFFSSPLNEEKTNLADLVFPNNTIIIYEGGGHVIQWMFHDDMNMEIWNFVKDRPGKKY